nr:hypothetical protein BaRGS_001611 [Batillaria attramentaria]
MVALFCIPITVARYVYQVWVFGDAMCKAVGYLQGISIVASVLTILCMAFDRYFAIRHPMKNRQIFTVRRVKQLVTITWFLAALLVIPVLVVRKVERHDLNMANINVHNLALNAVALPEVSVQYCIEAWPSSSSRNIYDLVFLGLVYVIPGTLTVCLYTCIGTTLWAKDQTLGRQNSYVANENRIVTTRRRLALMMIILSVLFAACWLPYYIINLLLNFDPSMSARLIPVYPFALLLGHSNSAQNPVLYCLMHRGFQQIVVRMLKCQCRQAFRAKKAAEDTVLRVVIIGKTGSGKSSLGNTLLGRDEFLVARGMSSGTDRCQWAETKRSGLTLQVTDTPGVCDTHRSEEEVLLEVGKSVAVASPGPHVILMALRCDRRFTQEEYEAYLTLKCLFGENICKHMMVVFAGADTFGDLPAEREEGLQEAVTTAPPQLAEVMRDAGGRYVGVNNRALGEDRDRQAQTLLATMHELVRTNEGRHFTSELTDNVAKQVEHVIKRRMEFHDVTYNSASRDARLAIVAEEEDCDPNFIQKLKDMVKHCGGHRSVKRLTDWKEGQSGTKPWRPGRGRPALQSDCRTTQSLRQPHIQPEVLYPIPDFSAFQKPVEPATDDLVPTGAKIVFLSINRYERKKNLGLAIRSFGKLYSDCKSGHLIMAGGYDERVRENVQHYQELRQLTSDLGLDDHVTFLRSFTDAQKRTLLNACSCLVYTPDKEHFGIVPIEAMYMQRPVIAVASGGPLETVENGKTGFLCEPTPDSFAEAMMKILKDPKLAKMLGENGKKRVEELFSFRQFTEKLDKIVKGLTVS